MLRANKLLISFLTIALVSFLVLGSGTLFAGEKKEAAKNDKKTKSVSAMKVGKDPEKTLRPVTKKEDKELSGRLNETLKKYPPHEVQKRGDGTQSKVVAPQFLNFSIATVGSDGKVTHTCVKGEKKHIDQTQAQVQSQPEEK